MLSIGPELVRIQCAGRAGMVHALLRLRELDPSPMPPGSSFPATGEVPCLRVEDAPRFGWRGLHVDVARHMLPVDALKRLLDAMALFHLNRLHWHLTDDQGWRLEIRGHPRLTDVGAQRAESPRRGARTEGDGTPYGGFYTQDEVREVVAHAEERGIVVVPEIDMPGHMQALLAAYPRCGHGPAPEVWTRWGVSERILNVKPATFALLDEILGEVAGLFPGPWIHLGGDEVPTTEWAACPDAQAVIAREGLRDERALQGWFLKRMAETVRALGKQPICWDDVLDCKGPEDAVIMVWQDAARARVAIEQGHEVVLCPQVPCYLDHYQGPPDEEPEAIGGLNTLDNLLAWEPLGVGEGRLDAGRVLGVQANLWSEYMPDAAHLEYMAWPRAAALAEVAWSSPEARRAAQPFRERWAPRVADLDALGVNHRRLDP